MTRKVNFKEQFEQLSDENRGKMKELSIALKKGYEDPVFFNKYFLGLLMHDGQKEYLRKSDVVWNPETTRKNILVPCNRWGKEQSVDEPVLTPNGWKRIGDIKIGDKVFTQDGTITNVSGVFPQGKKTSYRFTFNDGSTTESGLEHLWFCKTRKERFNKNGSYKVLRTKDIIEYGGMNPDPHHRISIPLVEPVRFSKKNLLIEPYKLGLLLGDGCFLKKVVRFSTKDKELLEWFQHTHIKGCDYGIAKTFSDIRKLGLHNRKSWNKFIPKEYLYSCVEDRINILRGLMDTDGNIEKSGKIEYNTVSRSLAEDVKFLVQSLGGKVVMSIKKTTHRDCYRLRIKIRINPFKLERKAKRFFITSKTYDRLLIKIEEVGKKESVCIMVTDKSHLYVTRDFIVTHNTVALATKHIRYNFYKIGVPRDTTMETLRDMRYSTLDLSPHSNQVVACFNYIFDILHNRFVTIENGKRQTNKCIIQSFFKGRNDSRNRIEFSNHSTFFGASTGEDQGASLAGRQFGYISYDECVFSHHLRTELPGRIMSRTVDLNSPIDLVSTYDTEAKSQQYYFGLVRRGLKGQNDWWVKTGTYGDNFFIPEETKEQAKKKIMNEDFNKYRQVFLGEAVPASTKVLEPEVVENVFDYNMTKQPPRYGHSYLISVDWGGSDQGDPTVMMVLDITDRTYKIVHHEMIKGGSPTVQFALLKTLQSQYNMAKIIMDTNALGGVLIKKILREMKVKTYDFDAHGGEKGEAIAQMKIALTYNRKYEINKDGKLIELVPNFGLVRSYYWEELEEQLGDYEVKDDKLVQDCVVCLYQALWFLEKKSKAERQTHVLKRRIR
jgi:hypothetical protein